MNENLKQKWDEAGVTPGKKVDVGLIVVCDCCDKDYTESTESGGFIFCSNAYCPACAPTHLKKIEEYKETHFIRALCPKGQPFADFVRAYRGPNNYIQIITGSL